MIIKKLYYKFLIFENNLGIYIFKMFYFMNLCVSGRNQATLIWATISATVMNFNETILSIKASL